MAVIKCLWTLERQSWRQFQIPSSAFFELCFCLYLSGTEKTQKQTIKGKTEQDTNEDEIVGLRLSQCGYLCPHPHGNPFLFFLFFFLSQVRKWHASQVWINRKLFLHAALRNRREEGFH